MVTGSLRQNCYVDVMHALANADIDIDKIKAKVIDFFYLGFDDSWQARPCRAS
jgi:hypothetical protein